MMNDNQRTDVNADQGTQHLWILFGVTCLFGLLAFLRYGGHWGQGDALGFTVAVRRMLDAGSLVTERTYPNGYAYQSIVILLSAVSGLQVSHIQAGWSIFLVTWVVVPAWLAYREFCRSAWAATLATTILLVQPEFLFPLLRGTHEKFTRGLMFLLLYALLRSLRSKKLSHLFALVGVFYLFAFGLITLNIYMATSFIISVGMALILVWGIRRITPSADAGREDLSGRLGLIVLSLLALAFIFMFYVFPPAQQQLLSLKSIVERVSLLFLSVEDTSVNPYSTVNTGWISLPVYLAVSLSNWLLLIASGLIWLKQSWSLIKKSSPIDSFTLLLWAFYSSFALQAVLSILIDLSNSLAANLQHRIFPSFVMLGAPYVSLWVLKQMKSSSPRFSKGLRWSLLLLIAVLFALSAVKATNEPLLSNYWVFYSQAEIQSVEWADAYLAGETVWAGYNPRLITGYYNRNQGTAPDIFLVNYIPDPAVPNAHIDNFIYSSIMHKFAERLGALAPMAADSSLTYDNGSARIYHTRPSTPFQR